MDAKEASSLKKITTDQYFRKRMKEEEQRAPKYDRFFRRRHVADMTYEHFRATGAHVAALDLSHLFHISLPQNDIQDFDTRWDQSQLSASEASKENVWETLQKMRTRASVQLQTV